MRKKSNAAPIGQYVEGNRTGSIDLEIEVYISVQGNQIHLVV